MMFFLRRFPVLFFLTWFTGLQLTSNAQCISTFPYTEHFDQSNGNWTSGGTASDWAWGVPKKSVIFKTSNTDKCWIIGGLTGNFYNNNENSWLKSPCFNFNELKNPYISFLVNWDSEKRFDGTTLQYSIDNGITWEIAGRFGDAPTSCNDNYWFQTSDIRYLPGEGWSGTANDGGGKGWVTAYHSFPALAGKANVMFRFVFGAGSFQNNFNGFAVDDFFIGEAITDQLAFSYACLNGARQASFTAQTNGCVDASTMQWNFNDAASGAGNTPTGQNVTHGFSSAGSFTVTLTGKNNRNETVTSSPQTILIPNLTATVKTPILCNGNTGLAEALVTNTNAAVSYSWSTNPVITASSAQLKAGAYMVTASVAGGCSNSAPVMLTEPPALEHTLQTAPADCNNQNGIISITTKGGTAPYRYTWQGIQYTTPGANNLPAGNYSITVIDHNACIDKVDVVLTKIPSTLDHSTNISLPDCGINNGAITINTSGGDPAYTYQWLPDITTANQASNASPGFYKVIITDARQCRDTAFITLQSKPINVSLGNDTFICKGQTLLLKPAGDFASFLWNDGATSPTKKVSSEGNYSVTIINAGGCIARDTVHISSGCGDLLFPSAFTPNGDGLNEQFGPTGGLSLVYAYRLLVYNRFGNLVFQSPNPYQKWSGESSGKKLSGTYTYIASYIYDGERKMKKGTIVLFF